MTIEPLAEKKASLARRRGEAVLKCGLYALFILLCFGLTMGISRFEILGVHAQMMTAAVVLVGMFEGRRAGAAAGVFSGALMDAAIARSEAFYILLFMLAGFICGLLCEQLFRRGIGTAVLFTAAVLAAQEVLFFSVFYLIAGRAGMDALIRVALPEGLFSLVLSPLLYLPARGLYTLTGGRALL